MDDQTTTVPLASAGGASATSASAKKRRNRNRNRTSNPNRNCGLHSKSQSPTRGDGNASASGGSSSHDNNHSPPKQQRGGGAAKSRSPTRRSNDNKSRSPTRRGGGGSKSHSPTRQHQHQHQHHGNHHPHHRHHRNHRHYRHQHLGPPSDMTVICNRSDLWDSAAHFQPDDNTLQPHHHYHPPDMTVRPYHFAPDLPHDESIPSSSADPASCSVAIARVPHHFEKVDIPIMTEGQTSCDVIDTSIPNPHDPEVVHDKYWAQRRRLFSKFDQGVQLDGQGWYSVTPEIIADHVAQRVGELVATHVIPHDSSEGIVLLDAFCGCGGNSIAFGKIPSNMISKVVCVDTDRNKLLKAAHNASLYGIPKDKLVFIECNSIFILQHCYKDGQFILDQPTAQIPPHMPPPVMPVVHVGYHVGGLDLLPRRIDAVFMDPPWGGVDYEVLGKNGYDLQKNMKIQVGPPVAPPVEEEYEADGDGCDDFFDMFAGPSVGKPKSKLSQQARKANFNKQAEVCGPFVDGMEMLRIAAGAVSAHVVVYDLPRNTNKASLAKCALGAGYRGNIKLEEHYLNGRLKTVTAYMGADYSEMINSLHDEAPASSGTLSSDDGAVTT